MPKALALGFCFWFALAVGAALVEAAVHCESSCDPGFPSWYAPWRWRDYHVVPEVAYIGAVAVATAIVFVVLVFTRRRSSAAVAYIVSTVLFSYPYLAGFGHGARTTVWIGSLLGVAALLALGSDRRRAR